MALDSLDMLLFFSKDVSALHMSHMRLTVVVKSAKIRKEDGRHSLALFFLQLSNMQ
jgi:hypothetical protein